MTEVLAPTMIDYAPPELAAEMVPRLLRGDETWCQGFSEPGTGSNLGVAGRAGPTPDRRRLARHRPEGVDEPRPVRRSAASCSPAPADPESAHRGITALFVDMDTPGITVRPIETMHGVDEFCEVFFDDVLVPADRMLGDEGQGWAVAMDLLPFERSTALWHRGAYLHRRLESCSPTAAEPDALAPDEVGRGVPAALRAAGPGPAPPSTAWPRATGSAPRPPSTRSCWPTAEQRSSTSRRRPRRRRAARRRRRQRAWRSEYLYSRAATIYGGSAEIQRNIVARRLLDLGKE